MSAIGNVVLKSDDLEVMCWTWQDGEHGTWDTYEVRNDDGDAVVFESLGHLKAFARELLKIGGHQ